MKVFVVNRSFYHEKEGFYLLESLLIENQEMLNLCPFNFKELNFKYLLMLSGVLKVLLALS